MNRGYCCRRNRQICPRVRLASGKVTSPRRYAYTLVNLRSKFATVDAPEFWIHSAGQSRCGREAVYAGAARGTRAGCRTFERRIIEHSGAGSDLYRRHVRDQARVDRSLAGPGCRVHRRHARRAGQPVVRVVSQPGEPARVCPGRGVPRRRCERRPCQQRPFQESDARTAAGAEVHAQDRQPDDRRDGVVGDGGDDGRPTRVTVYQRSVVAGWSRVTPISSPSR